MRGMLSSVSVLTVLLCSLTASTAQAQAGVMGLYLDEARTSWCATGTPPYNVEVWVYAAIEGGTGKGEGIVEFAFDLGWSGNMAQTGFLDNPHRLPEECLPGYCPPGISGKFDGCLLNWVWLVRVTMTVFDSNPAVLQIVPVPEYGEDRLWNCGRTIFVPTVVQNVYLNYDAGSPECSIAVPVEETTWGAVKALYE